MPSFSLPMPSQAMSAFFYNLLKPFYQSIIGSWQQSFDFHMFLEFVTKYSSDRSSPPEVFSGKGVVKICSKFKGEHPYRSVISSCFATFLKSHFGMGVLL